MNDRPTTRGCPKEGIFVKEICWGFAKLTFGAASGPLGDKPRRNRPARGAPAPCVALKLEPARSRADRVVLERSLQFSHFRTREPNAANEQREHSRLR